MGSVQERGFVILSDEKGSQVFVVSDDISAVAERKGKGSRIYLRGGQEIDVRELPMQVHPAIRKLAKD